MLQIIGPIIEPCGTPEVGLNFMFLPPRFSGPITKLVAQRFIKNRYLLAKGTLS